MGVRLPDASALGARPVPQSDRPVLSYQAGLAEQGAMRAAQMEAETSMNYGDVGKAISDVAQQYAKAEEQQNIVAGQNDILQGIDAINAERETDTDWRTMGDRYTEKTDALWKSIQDKYKGNSAVLSALQTDFTKAELKQRIDARKQSRDLQLDDGRATLDATLNTLVREHAKNAEDPAAQAEVMAQAETAVARMEAFGIIDRQDAVKRLTKFGEDSAETQVLHLINTNPDAAIRVLGDASKFEGLNAERRQRLLSSAIVKSEHLQNKMDKQRREYEREQERQKNVSDVLTALQGGGTFLDPGNKDQRRAVDDAWGEMSQGLAEEEQLDLLNRFSQRTGMLPDRVKTNLYGAMSVGSPEQKAEAANVIASIRSANPEALRDIDSDTRSMANYIHKQVSLGVDPAKAAERYTESLQVNEVQKKARAAEFAAKIKEYTSNKTINDGLSEYYKTGMFEKSPMVGEVAAAEFLTLAEDEFSRNGDFDSAFQTARDTLRNTWGTSRINDAAAPTLMKHAPEKFYGDPALSVEDNAKWMREQLIDDLTRLGGMYEEGSINGAKVSPIPTMRRPDGRPVYMIMTGGGNIVLGKNNKPLAWTPDREAYIRRKNAKGNP